VCLQESTFDMVFHLVAMETDLEYGVERNIGLDGLSEKQCEDAVERLVKQQEVVGQGSVS